MADRAAVFAPGVAILRGYEVCRAEMLFAMATVRSKGCGPMAALMIELPLPPRVG